MTKSTERHATRKKAAAAPAGGGVFTHPLFWASAVFLVVVCIIFRAIVFGGMTFVSPDATAPLGFVRVGEASLKAGTYPLWNPYVFTGMPSFASGAYNPLIYPPDWPVAIVQKLLPLPDVSWMLLYYFLAGLGTFVLARHWGASAGAAIVAGVAFMVTPNLVANGAHGHGSQMVCEAYLPWMLWLTSRVWRDGKLSDVATLALLVGFQLLRGHVQIAYYGWLAMGLLSLFEFGRRVTEPDGVKKSAGRIAGLAIVLGLGFALSAFYSLPIRAYAEHSIRSIGPGGGVAYDYATGWSFSPVEMLTFLVPGALGFGGATYWGTMPFTDFPNYMGLAILACAFLAVAAGRRRYEVLFLLALGAFALLVSFGRHGALYPFLFEHLPLFNKFRVPVMILILLQLSVAVLAGLGLTAIGEAAGDEKLRRRLLLWGGVVTAIVAIGLLTGLAGDTWREAYTKAAHASRDRMQDAAIDAGYRAFQSDLVRVTILALVALGGLLLSLRGTLKPAAAFAVVGVVTLLDLGPVDSRLMADTLGEPRMITAAAERDEVISFLESKKATEGEFRILPFGDFTSNRYAGFTLASLGGYHAAKPKLYQAFLDADSGRTVQSPVAWRLLNVRYLLVPGLLPDTPGITEVFRGQREVVYEFAGALPRATLVPAFRVGDPKQPFARFTDPTLDPAEVTILDRDPGITPVPGGTVKIDEYGLNRVKLTVDAPGPALVRLADLSFPGWTASVDGKAAPAFVGDGITRVVAVPAGSHSVVWTFHDPAMETGLRISIGALVAILALYGAAWFARRRAKSPAEAAAQAA